MRVTVEISPGELLDKLAILEIKQDRITTPEQLANIGREKAALEAAAGEEISSSPDIIDLRSDIKAVNEELWVIEDDIRLCERDEDFGERFVTLARKVYLANDRRAALKKQINDLFGSDIAEEKSYAGR